MSLTDDIIKTEVERHVQLYNIEQLKKKTFSIVLKTTLINM